MIVAPTYLAQICGYSAVRISARKARLIDLAGNVAMSVFYSAADNVAAKTFVELVDLITGRKKAEITNA